ncbi:MAG: large conductance mechanosensitive channel protein MscL [Candidatus Dormibacteraceae bacterium]
MTGFKTFLLRGSVVDLAVGIIIGAAFGTVVQALVKDLVTPLVAALFGKPDFGGLYFTVNNSRFLYGDFLNALLAFLIVAAVVYYFIVLPYAGFRSRFEPAPTPAPEVKDCPWCLSPIPVGARKCAFCATDQA